MREVLKKIRMNLDLSSNKHTGNQLERAVSSVGAGGMDLDAGYGSMGHKHHKKYGHKIDIDFDLD